MSTSETLLTTIRHYISRHALPMPPATLLVALSGGADSVALLLILKALGYRLIALHCNFHLRGAESDRDEQFVRELCGQEGIELRVQHFETTAYAQQQGLSIEMAARELRYTWFETQRQELGAVAIAVAHHSDDNAETLLLNLVRGSGIHGLKGMLPHQGFIIRPLLCVRRTDLEVFLAGRGQGFVTDSTNLETVYKRNKIRHEVLPLLRTLNPSIDTCLAQTAQRLAEAECLYCESVERKKLDCCEVLSDGLRIRLDRLEQQVASATLLHEYLQDFGFSAAEIAEMSQSLRRPTGTCYQSSTHMAVWHRGVLEVRRIPQQQADTLLPEVGCMNLTNGRALQIDLTTAQALPEIPKQLDKVALDRDRIHGKLLVRSIREGDRFQPFGMKGTKLVSDYLTDRHRSLIDKQGALVVCDEQGIVWLVGERPAQRVAITAETTDIYLLSLSR